MAMNSMVDRESQPSTCVSFSAPVNACGFISSVFSSKRSASCLVIRILLAGPHGPQLGHNLVVQRLFHLQEGEADRGTVQHAVVKGQPHGHLSGLREDSVMEQRGPEAGHLEGLGAEGAHGGN